MNKKAQTLGITIVSAIFLFIIALVCANFLFDEVTNGRVNLGCTNIASVSDGTKLTCLGIDIIIPYFVYLAVALIVGGIAARLAL